MKKLFFSILTTLTVLTIVTPLPSSATEFPDVKPDAWFYPYVQEISEQGIMEGYPNGSFGAWDSVNRAELAKIILELKQSLQRPWWEEHLVEIILVLITLIGWTAIVAMMHRIASRPVIIKSEQEHHHQPSKPVRTNSTLIANQEEKDSLSNEKLGKDFEEDFSKKNQKTNWWV